MPGIARVAMALAISAISFTMSCCVVANEAPLQVASLAKSDTLDLLPMQTRGEPFNLSAAIAPALAAKWKSAEESIRKDIAAAERCRADENLCTGPVRKLNAFAATARELSGRARLGVINRAINLAVAAAPDGNDDVWSPPLETLASGKGDCEDYAILKIAILQAAGMSADDLRLMVVRDPASPDTHAVAAARFEGRWLILDNRRFTLVDAAHSEYRALYALHPLDAASDMAVAQGPSGSGAVPILL